MSYTKEGVPTLAGIDTLYYFADVTCTNYAKKWPQIQSGEYKEGYEFIGYSGKTHGFVGAWYQHKKEGIPLFRIGFKDPEKQKQVKNVYIQLEAVGIYSMGLENLLQYVHEELSEFKVEDYYPSRADLNLFVQYSFRDADWRNFRSRSKAKKGCYQDYIFDLEKNGYVYMKKGLETLYLGSRTSPIYFKIYDKALELRKKARSNEDATMKLIVMKNYFRQNGMDITGPIWNIEFTIKREGLKQYGVDTIRDLLEKAGSIFSDLMTKYVYLGNDLEAIEEYRASRSLNKLPTAPIWEYFASRYNLYNRKPAFRQLKERKASTKEHRLYIIQRELEYLVKDQINVTLQELYELHQMAVARSA